MLAGTASVGVARQQQLIISLPDEACVPCRSLQGQCSSFLSACLTRLVCPADPFKVIAQAQAKLALNAAPLQIPLGLEERHSGLIDLLSMKAYSFDGAHGQDISVVSPACASTRFIRVSS